MPGVDVGWTGIVDVEVTMEPDGDYVVVRVRGERSGTPIQVRQDAIGDLKPPSRKILRDRPD